MNLKILWRRFTKARNAKDGICEAEVNEDVVEDIEVDEDVKAVEDVEAVEDGEVGWDAATTDSARCVRLVRWDADRKAIRVRLVSSIHESLASSRNGKKGTVVYRADKVDKVDDRKEEIQRGSEEVLSFL